MRQLHELPANLFFSTCFVLFLFIGPAVAIKSLIEISMALDDNSAIGSYRLATGTGDGPSDDSERSELSGASDPDWPP